MPTFIKEAAKRKRAQEPRRNTKPGLKTGKLRVESKTAVILRLLQRRTGVTLKDLMAATGWQAHSVRGFISAGGKRIREVRFSWIRVALPAAGQYHLAAGGGWIKY